MNVRAAFVLAALACAACSSKKSSSTLSDAALPDMSVATIDAAAPDAASSDTGVAMADAASQDATSVIVDASPDAVATRDAASDALVACDPSVFNSLPRGASLEEGTLCDDVFVCVDDADDAARVTSASSKFVCSSTPEGQCDGWTCRYADPGGPSTLDAAEVQQICAVTQISPQRNLLCMVYL